MLETTRVLRRVEWPRMSEPRPHLKTLEEIERTCVPGLVEVMRAEGIEGVRYALWDITNRHRDYDVGLYVENEPQRGRGVSGGTVA